MRRVTFSVTSHPNKLAVLTDIADGAALHKGNLPYSVSEDAGRATFTFEAEEAADWFIRLAKSFAHARPLPEPDSPNVT